MIADRNSGNTAPLTWVGSFPVYASTVLAAVHAALLVVTALFMAAEVGPLIFETLGFSSSRVLGSFAVWQFFTYAFVHPPDIWFLLELYLLVVFGRELESSLGRRAFLKLYAVLLLLPPLVLTVVALAGFPSVYAGSSALHFSVFLAFATLYPTAQIFFGLPARWVALALLAISALQCLAYLRKTDFLVLLLDAMAAFVTIQFLSGKWAFALPARKSPFRVVKPPQESPPEDSSAASIDSILEKISRSGIRSLTANERAQLEKARTELLKKDRNP
ncbi:MAG: rhomboid family intramembrane serine protease [Chthoniobacterales bacterium]|nr:rhomboid family intramembrane serine protease [Chthoniobacterales bacterium]